MSDKSSDNKAANTASLASGCSAAPLPETRSDEPITERDYQMYLKGYKDGIEKGAELYGKPLPAETRSAPCVGQVHNVGFCQDCGYVYD